MTEQNKAVEAIRAFLPTNLSLDNPNIGDDVRMPLDCTMGELRALAVASTATSEANPTHDIGLAGELEARRAYEIETANHPTIHTNRFPAWDELTDEKRAERITALQSNSDSELLRRVQGCAYPVCQSIDKRGYRWCEAYLDQVKPEIDKTLARLEQGAG